MTPGSNMWIEITGARCPVCDIPLLRKKRTDGYGNPLDAWLECGEQKCYQFGFQYNIPMVEMKRVV